MQKDDVIYRQQAIDAIFGRSHEIIKARLKNLPPAQQERKKGKWEIYVISMLDGEGCRCSECGFEGAPYWDYCPNCGSPMEGVVYEV